MGKETEDAIPEQRRRAGAQGPDPKSAVRLCPALPGRAAAAAERRRKLMALTLFLTLAGGFVGGSVGGLAVLIWADGLLDHTAAWQDLEDWAPEEDPGPPKEGEEEPI